MWAHVVVTVEYLVLRCRISYAVPRRSVRARPSNETGWVQNGDCCSFRYNISETVEDMAQITITRIRAVDLIVLQFR